MTSEMIDINDMSNLTLSELMPQGETMDNANLDLALRALESKLLKIPSRVQAANPDIDFDSGIAQSVSIDLADIASEMYEFVACLREYLPVK